MFRVRWGNHWKSGTGNGDWHYDEILKPYDAVYKPFDDLIKKINSNINYHTGNVVWKDDTGSFETDLPGVKKENVSITYADQVLTIEWLREGCAGQWSKAEIDTLRALDPDSIEATLELGVLKVTFKPFVKPNNSKKINVK